MFITHEILKNHLWLRMYYCQWLQLLFGLQHEKKIIWIRSLTTFKFEPINIIVIWFIHFAKNQFSFKNMHSMQYVKFDGFFMRWKKKSRTKTQSFTKRSTHKQKGADQKNGNNNEYLLLIFFCVLWNHWINAEMYIVSKCIDYLSFKDHFSSSRQAVYTPGKTSQIDWSAIKRAKKMEK